MAYIIYNKLWEKEIGKIVFKKDKIKDMNINQLKLKLDESYEKDEKITTHFESVINDDVINKTYLDKNFKN